MPDAAIETPTPAAPPLSPVERAMAALDPKPPEPVAEAPAPEPAKEETPAPAPVAPSVAERFAAMAKREAKIVERDRAAKEREAKLAEREAAIKAAEEKRSGYAKDPLQALSDLGLSYEDLTKLMLNKTDPSAQQALAIRQLAEQTEQARREAAEARAAVEKAKQESAQAEADRTRTGFKSEVAGFVKSNADKYELIALYGQEELVFGVIEAEYEKTGEMLSVEAAADKVEKYLDGEAEKAFKAKKFQSRFAPPAPKPAAPPTLTNAVTPAPGPARPRLTEAERLAAAIAALKD